MIFKFLAISMHYGFFKRWLRHLYDFCRSISNRSPFHTVYIISRRVSRKLPSAEARKTQRSVSKFSVCLRLYLRVTISRFPFQPRLWSYRNGAQAMCMCMYMYTRTVSLYKFTNESRTPAPVIRGTPGCNWHVGYIRTRV